jgi:hypothetical protein
MTVAQLVRRSKPTIIIEIEKNECFFISLIKVDELLVCMCRIVLERIKFSGEIRIGFAAMRKFSSSLIKMLLLINSMIDSHRYYSFNFYLCD